MENDVGLQRAILNSIRETRTTATRTFAPTSTFRTTARDIAPTVPMNRTRVEPRPVRRTTEFGRKNTLQREGIAPVVESRTPVSSGLTSVNDTPPSIARRTVRPGVSPSRPVRSSTSSGLFDPDQTFTRTPEGPSRLPRQSYESLDVSEAPPPVTAPRTVAAGWVEREPIQPTERYKGAFQAQNPSGSHFCLESPAGAAGCTVFTSTSSEGVLREHKRGIALRGQLKLVNRRSELFFFVLDYVQPSRREPGAFVAVSLHGIAGAWRVERYVCGRRVAVYAEAPLDARTPLSSWLNVRLTLKNNRLSLFMGSQPAVGARATQSVPQEAQIFSNVDIGEGQEGDLGDCGVGVFHGKVQMKDWSVTVGDGLAHLVPAEGFVDPQFAAIIEREIMHTSPGVPWESIAALDDAKRLLNEAVVLPMLVPEFFTGIREPWKGVLLFGPPGTGKTMLAKAVATCANTTFFNCSASVLVSKYHGESERLVRALFQMARKHAPSTIFFDEIDSLMGKRGTSTEHEASRRLKSEILTQIDGVSSKDGRLMMVLATTNKPWDLDEALRRRLEKRIYIPLPNITARVEMFRLNLKEIKIEGHIDYERLAQLSEGYSGADIHQVCRDACMMPMRRLIANKSPQDIKVMKERGLLENPPVQATDFEQALRSIQPSVSATELHGYERWLQEFGSL